MDMLTSNVERY